MTHHIAKYIQIKFSQQIKVNWFNADTMKSELHQALTLAEVQKIAKSIRELPKQEHKMIAAAITTQFEIGGRI